MPICPLCMTTIHVGAKIKCPACGYALPQAVKKFAPRSLHLMPVVDEAGMFTLEAQQKLAKALKRMERRIRPAVLSVYLTNHASRESFAYYAHYLLNSAEIYEPSFGDRGAVNMAQETLEVQARAELKVEAIERELQHDEHEAVLEVGVENVQNTGGDTLPDAWMRKSLESARSSWLKPLWTRVVGEVKTRIKGIFSARPVDSIQKDFVLLLVIDVQLEMACFSWGYMLDPYVDSIKINNCILDANLDFREFDMSRAIMKVMRSAVSQIAAGAGAANRRQRMTEKRRKRFDAMASSTTLSQWLIIAICGGLLMSSPCSLFAQDAAVSTAQKLTVDSAQNIEELVGAPPKSEVMMLFAPEKPNVLSHPLSGEALQLFEDDVQRAYLRPRHEGGFVLDPRLLLNAMERSELNIFLKSISQKVPYQIYVVIFNHADLIPEELHAQSLLSEHAPASEYALMIEFPLGDAAAIRFSLQGMEITDSESQACLLVMQQAAAPYSAPLDAIKAAVLESVQSLETAQLSFKMLDAKSPMIHIDFKEQLNDDDIGSKEKLLLLIGDVKYKPYYYALGSLILCLSGAFLFRAYWCYSYRLLTSEPDSRLGSPYGAAVSEPVFYKQKSKSKIQRNVWTE